MTLRVEGMSISEPKPAVAGFSAPPPFDQPSRWRRWAKALGITSRRRCLAAVAALVLLGAAAFLLGRQAWARHQLRAAQTEWQRHHYDRAREHLENCLAVWPDDADALLLAARIARRKQTFDVADKLLDRYLAIRGDDDDLTLERVLVRAERGDVDDVKLFCEKLIAAGHPQTPQILEAAAMGYIRNFRFDEAVVCLQLWQKREPDSAQVAYLGGYVSEQAMHPRDAVQAHRRAVELDPDHDEARLHLVMVLLDLAQAQDALPHARRLVERRPNWAPALVELGRCLDQLGQQEESERVFARALELQPRHAGALLQRGMAALRHDDLAAAETLLRQACTLAPGSYQAHYQLALCLQRLGKTDEARDLEPYLKQLEKDSKRLTDIFRQDMTEILHNPDRLCELGNIALRAGSAEQALRWYDAALKADPSHIPTHEAYARYYQGLGQIGRAARHLEFAKSKGEKQAPQQ